MNVKRKKREKREKKEDEIKAGKGQLNARFFWQV
jgi:hypothetical protein